MHNDLLLLDCTLRDGGYVNNWEWGYDTARDIIRSLVRAGVDVVEVGFLRNTQAYDPNVTVCSRIEELNRLLPEDCGHTMFSAMAMRSNYDIDQLSPYSGSGVEMIRITAHEYDLAEGMDFARQVKAKGYKLSINPINIMGYSDAQILWILQQVNEIQPYQFAVVDTFGSMKRRDLDRIMSLVDHNLDRNIRVSLHLHENMSLSCCLAQSFIDRHLNRPTAVDGSLMGMGRIPGNLPIELIADYLNDYSGNTYDIDDMMDAIQDHIAPLKGDANWGYTPAYFLSARFNLHRNYAEHYLNKGDLTNRDIDRLLARIDRSKAAVFDAAYADVLYHQFKSNRIDDTQDRRRLQEALSGRSVLLIAPGASIREYPQRIRDYIRQNQPVVIGVNFVPGDPECDYVFFSNHKRFTRMEKTSAKLIVTSNLTEGEADYRIDYNSLSGSFEQGCNSLLMLLTLLKAVGVEHIAAAGADGYAIGARNYYSNALRSSTEHGNAFNLAVADAMKKIGVKVQFLTPSAYAAEM